MYICSMLPVTSALDPVLVVVSAPMEGNELTSIARSVVDAAVSDQGRLDNDRFDD